jgi:hypothetical protein
VICCWFPVSFFITFLNPRMSSDGNIYAPFPACPLLLSYFGIAHLTASSTSC